MSLRKAVCAAVAVLCVGVASASAEMHPQTLGVRFGGGSLSGLELSYQKSMGDINRLELGGWWGYDWGSGWSINYYGVNGFWHWRWDVAGVDGLGWYIGPGAQVAYWSQHYNFLWVSYASKNGVYVNVGGEIGLEYDLNKQQKVPVLLSLDIRPMVSVVGGVSFYYGGALAVRYTF